MVEIQSQTFLPLQEYYSQREPNQPFFSRWILVWSALSGQINLKYVEEKENPRVNKRQVKMQLQQITGKWPVEENGMVPVPMLTTDFFKMGIFSSEFSPTSVLTHVLFRYLKCWWLWDVKKQRDNPKEHNPPCCRVFYATHIMPLRK